MYLFIRLPPRAHPAGRCIHVGRLIYIVYIHTYIHTYTHPHTHTYIYIYIYIYICMYVYICIYLFIYVRFFHVSCRRTPHPSGPPRADTRPTFLPDPPRRHRIAYTHTHIYIYIYVFMGMSIYIYIYLLIYIYALPCLPPLSLTQDTASTWAATSRHEADIWARSALAPYKYTHTHRHTHTHTHTHIYIYIYIYIYT